MRALPTLDEEIRDAERAWQHYMRQIRAEHFSEEVALQLWRRYQDLLDLRDERREREERRRQKRLAEGREWAEKPHPAGPVEFR